MKREQRADESEREPEAQRSRDLEEDAGGAPIHRAAQCAPDDDALPRRESGALDVGGKSRRGLPHGIERQVEREPLDLAAPVRKSKVVREQVFAAARDENVGERVFQTVQDGGVVERWVGGTAATPLERRAVAPGILIHLGEIPFDELALRSRVGSHARDPVELQLLAQGDVELPLAAVPGAGEDDRLVFADMEPSIGVEPRLHREISPEE